MAGAGLVLGSATPSLEAYSRALRGRYRLLCPDGAGRKKDSRLAQTEVVDLREELKSGNRSIFSRRLQELMEDRMEKKEQIMLFINRRGYSSFVSCRSCGEALKCPHCDVSLTLHRNGRLKCHYCGYEIPHAGPLSPSLRLPLYRRLRNGNSEDRGADKKNVSPGQGAAHGYGSPPRKREGMREILSAFAGRGGGHPHRHPDDRKGGHDFPKVTLVGVLAADLSLHAPDFACGGADLSDSDPGRRRGAGRGTDAGSVVIQTYLPDHYSIQAAAAQDYGLFYEKEMTYRRLLPHYPPALCMLTIGAACGKEEVLDSGGGETMGRTAKAAVNGAGEQGTAGRQDGEAGGPAPEIIGR